MLSFVSLSQTAFERSPTLLPWLYSWLGNSAEVLAPIDWYTRGHDVAEWLPPTTTDFLARPLIKPGTFIWAPPPAAADVAIEELRKARIKRQESTHIFVCPRLFVTRWLRQLYKASDIVFELRPGKGYWPSGMFEPLLIGICFPFLSSKPWQVRGTPRMYAAGRTLRGLSKDPDVDKGNFLSKFFCDIKGLSTLPVDVVSRVLYFRPEDRIPHCSKQGR